MKKKLRNRIVHRAIVIPEIMILDTIVNTPLDLKTGEPIERRATVEERKLVRKGQHMYWRALLQDNRGRLYLREVLV